MRLGDKLFLLAALVSLTAATRSTLLNSEDLHEKRVVLQDQDGPVSAVAFLPDGNSLVTGGADGLARLWDTRVMDLPVLKAVLRGHGEAITAAAVSPDGRWIATASLDKTLRLWRAEGGKPGRVIDVGALPFCLAFSTDSRRLAAGQDDGAVGLWEIGSGRSLARLAGPGGNVYALTFSKKGLLAAGAEEGAIALWDLDRSTSPAARWDAHQGLVSALAFSGDGQRLASGGWDRQVKVWSVPEGRPLNLMTGHADSVTSLAFLADGTLISGGRDKVRFWDADTGVEKELLNAPDDGALSVAASPDGHVLASGNQDATARLYLLREAADLRAVRAPPAKEPFSPW